MLLQSSTAVLGNNPFAVQTVHRGTRDSDERFFRVGTGHSNRLGRVVDRTRMVYADLAAGEPGSQGHRDRAERLGALRASAQMLLRALRLFYAALGFFAASTLVSVGSSIAAFGEKKLFFEIAAGLDVLTGASAVVGLAVGCTLMVHETSLAVQSLVAEAEIRLPPGKPSGPKS